MATDDDTTFAGGFNGVRPLLGFVEYGHGPHAIGPPHTLVMTTSRGARIELPQPAGACYPADTAVADAADAVAKTAAYRKFWGLDK